MQLFSLAAGKITERSPNGGTVKIDLVVDVYHGFFANEDAARRDLIRKVPEDVATEDIVEVIRPF